MPCDCPAAGANNRGHHWVKCERPGCGQITYDPLCGPVAGRLIWVDALPGTFGPATPATFGLIVACGKVVVAPPIARRVLLKMDERAAAEWLRRRGATVQAIDPG